MNSRNFVNRESNYPEIEKYFPIKKCQKFPKINSTKYKHIILKEKIDKLIKKPFYKEILNSLFNKSF